MGKLAACDAFVEVGVPPVERERADARTVGLRQKFRRSAYRLGEIGTQLSDVWTGNFAGWFLLDAVLPNQRCELFAAFEYALELWIGAAVKRD